jgi:hypothetical protein
MMTKKPPSENALMHSSESLYNKAFVPSTECEAALPFRGLLFAITRHPYLLLWSLVMRIALPARSEARALEEMYALSENATSLQVLQRFDFSRSNSAAACYLVRYSTTTTQLFARKSGEGDPRSSRPLSVSNRSL